jgi:hypothetical protein
MRTFFLLTVCALTSTSLFMVLLTAVASDPGGANLPGLPASAQATVSAALRPGWTQQTKITSADGAVADQFGWSVFASGTTVVAGAPLASIGSNAQQGAAYVFVGAKNFAHLKQVAKLTASDGKNYEHFGMSASISGDTVAVGSPDARYGGGACPPCGAVYVFVKPAGGWEDMTETAKLRGMDSLFLTLGSSLAVSGDTIIAGADQTFIGSNQYQGMAYVFVKPKGGWVSGTEAAKLTASDGQQFDLFSNSVAISGDTIVAGAEGWPTGKGQGAAYVFVKPANGWTSTTETARLTARGGQHDERLGSSVAIMRNTVVACAPGYPIGFNGGACYVFLKPTSGWRTASNYKAQLTASDGQGGDLLGWSVFLSGDSSTLVAGAPYVNYLTGASYVFTKPSSGWKSTSHFDAKLAASDGKTYDRFGYSVWTSGRTVIAGTPWALIGSHGDQGAAYVFGR